MASNKKVRHLHLVLGDQLTLDTKAFKDFDPEKDQLWMAEVKEESSKVLVHKVRSVMFLSAMRHFKAELEKQKISITYWHLDDNDNPQTFSDCLEHSLKDLEPEKVILTEPGEWQIEQDLEATLKKWGGEYEIHPDTTFFASKEDFKNHAKGRKQLRMEYFYREMRERYQILLDEDNEPEGGQWNYDKENRDSFGKDGPPDIPEPLAFKPDKLTKDVIKLVNKIFPDNPGNLEQFDWPVTAKQAEKLLEDFIKKRLATFGQYQDAMWDEGQLLDSTPYHCHSKLSAAINLKLLLPKHVVKKVEQAYRSKDIPLASAEGFIRQILGWREFIRGIYWQHMPEYLSMNALNATSNLPEFYWTGDTDMNCLRHTITQTLEYGYTHHIQRLMVTGLYALLLGVEPKQIHEWYLGIYIDAVEWVELPNTLGMSQYVDDGLFGSKPYVATGKYIDKMSNYCKNCQYDPKEKTGDDACPFTTLYWDFLLRNKDKFEKHPRMALQVRNLKRLNDDTKAAITKQARALKG
jgi:deoxyribodipyrimidine photolyase-related protein